MILHFDYILGILTKTKSRIIVKWSFNSLMKCICLINHWPKAMYISTFDRQTNTLLPLISSLKILMYNVMKTTIFKDLRKIGF